MTGSPYLVQKYEDGEWISLETPDGTAWTMEAWPIPINDTVEWKVNWEWLFGSLPSGHYRIGKSFMDFRAAGDYDQAVIYAEFDIP